MGRLVMKKRKPKSPLKLVDEPSDEGVPVEEPAYNEEDANLQRALELSLMEQGAQTQGPTRPVVIREPESGRIQPLPEVQGKGKEKVVEEQAAHDLLTLQTPQKKSLADQFIFQKRPPMPTESSAYAESPSMDAELNLADSDLESDEEVSKINAGNQEGQAGPNPGIQDEGQARPNPGELEQHMANLIQNNLALEERLDKNRTRLYNLENLNIPYKGSSHFDMKENSSTTEYYSNQRLADQEEACKKRQKRRDIPRTPPGSPPSPPPPPPPLAGASGAPGSKAPSSSKTAASASQSMAWTTSDTRFKSTDFMAAQELSPTDSLMQDDSIPDEQLDVENNWASALAITYEPLAENSLLAKTRDMMTFLKWYCRQVNKTELTQADLEGQAYKVVDWANPEGDQVRINVNRPLPLGGPLRKLSYTLDFQINAASYPDFGLELLVPEQIWIDEVCTYNNTHRISCRPELKPTQIRYDNSSKNVLRRADHQEHTIAEKDFKNMYPNDFEDLNLLLLQGHLNHLSGSDKRMLSTAVKLWTQNLVIRQRVEDFQLGIESYQTQLNLTKPGWDAIGYEFKHDYTIIESP
ncbi:retrovirus-related pol polyprotein from transposon TNT 1-94 [Tanacetum coccineum]